MTIALVVVSCDVRVVGGWFDMMFLQDGNTALLLACENGHLAVARWLIEDKGADYRAEKDNVSGMCFRLEVASGASVVSTWAGSELVVVWLVSQTGNTALLLACLAGQLAVARWLIDEKGVDYRAEMNDVSGSF